MFAANSGTNNIDVVDVAKREFLSTSAVGKDPYGASLAPVPMPPYASLSAAQAKVLAEFVLKQ